MAYIVKRTFGVDGERLGIGIQNEELIRRIAWGSTWTTLRMALRVAIVPPNDLSTLTDTRFFIGFCSGTDPRGGYYSAYTNSVVGWRLLPEAGTDATNPMYYNAGAGNPYYNRNYNYGYAQWHYGGSYYNSLTPADGPIPSIPTVYGSAIQRRMFLMLELKKPGAPYGNATQYAMRLLGTGTASADQTTDNFLQNVMKNANFVGTQTLNLSSAQLLTAPVSESVAPLDCISITWQASVPLEIYDILLFDKNGPL